MYSITYGDDLLYDPLDADAYPVSDVSLSAEINGSGSCEFSITKTHPLYDVIDLYDTDRLITVTEDSHILFKGYVASVDEDEYGVRTYSCTGILSFLKKSVVRPYSTDAEDEKHVKAPSTIDGFFNWLISEHDNHTDRRKRFIVGRNEGDIVRRENVIHASSDSASTTANVLQSELLDGLGGYVFVRYGDDGVTYLDYLSECRDTNAQIIDFGVNLVSYSRTDDAMDVATVCYAKGGTPERDEGSDKDKPPVDLTKYPDGPFARGSYRFEKSGDRIICLDLVDKYGYSEMTFEDSDILDPYELLDSAAIALLKQLEPKVTIDIRAIDLSLFMDGYEPLRCGELVRVRSNPNGFDSYMLVSGMDLDLENPENTEYTLGTTFDAFTGESNKIIRQLNATINKSVDQVTALDQTTKDQAIQIGKVEDVANDASNKADTAQNTANTAQTTANTANATATTAKNVADNAQTTATAASNTAADAKTTADSANKAAEELKKKTAEIDKQVEAVSNAADAASAKADQVRTDLTQQVQNVKSEMDSAVEAAQTSANNAQSAADAAQKAADKANASTVDLDKSIKAVDAKAIAAKQAAAEAQSKAENVASDLDSANAVIEQHTTELGELTTKVSNAITKSDSALSVSTEAKQTATEASTTATSAYNDSQTALTQSTTATQTATAAKTTAESASKTATDSLKQSSAAVQTANQISTTLRTEYQTKADSDKIYATQSSLKQTSDSITASVSNTYATKDALSALQNVADNAIESWRGTGVPTLTNKPASDWTTDADKKKHSGDLYYDKSTGKAYRFGSDDGVTYTWELNQDTDVTKALEDAANAQTSANNAQASATAANTAASNAQSTANTAVSNAATAKNAADAAQSSANKAQDDVDKLKIDIPATYATKSSLTQTAESITANVESVKTTANSAVTAASNAQQTADGISVNLTKNYQTKSQADTIYATKANLKATSDSISAEVTKAQGTADGAVTAASKAQQTADAVTLNLSKNYNTKAQNDAVYATQTSLKATSDSLSANITANANTAQSAVDKATSLEANLNGFKTTVSQTYTTKTDFNNLTIGGTNRIVLTGVKPGRIDSVGNVGFDAAKNDHCYTVPVSAERNTKYTVSGSIATPNGCYVSVAFYDENGKFISRPINAYSTTEAPWKVTFTSPANAVTMRSSFPVIFKGKIKLEKGTKPTDWSPAPEDLLTDAEAAQTYATNSSLTQTANSIKAQVTEVSNTANSAMSKATTVEQTANGLSSKITEQGKTLNATVKIANEAKSTADSNKTTISQTTNLIDAALTGDNLIIDGGFESTEYWKGLKAPFRLSVGSLYHGSHVLVADAVTSGDIRCPLTHPKGNASESITIAVTSGRTYRLGGYVRWLDAVPNNLNRSSDKLRLAKADGTFISEARCSTSNKWSYTYADWHCPDDGSITSVKIEVMHQHNATILWDDVSFCDITEAFNTNSKVVSVEQNLNGFKTTVAETYQTKSGMSAYATNSSLTQTANSIKAQVTEVSNTANGAMSKATTVEQTANGLSSKITEQGKTLNATVKTANEAKSTADSNKASISQVSTTASNALTKASSVEQNLNGFKTTVSQTYSHGSNLWVNPTFDADKPQITSLVNNVTAPNGSGVNLLAGRDHHNNATSFPVVPGHTYVITATIKRLNGEVPLNAGIWYTSQTSGNAYDTYVGTESTSDIGDGWINAKWRFSCPNGKSKGCVFFQINQSASNGSTKWYVSNVICIDVTGLQPAGDYATSSSLTQTANSIRSQVTEVSNTANSAMSKATTVEQTANGLSTKITEQGKTLNATVKTANEAKSTADSNKASISQVSTTASSALTKASSVEQNLNGFKTTVSQTYATKNDVGVGNLIKNGDFSDGSSNWTTNGGTSKIVDGTYGKQFVFTQTGTNMNGSNRIYNRSYNHVNGQAYEVSFYAKADKSSKWNFGPNGSSKAASVTLDTTLKQYTMQYQADETMVLSIWTDNPTATIHLERVKLSIASGYYATKSYVDQTSRTVSLGVVEEYKNGQHGSGLATKSDITVAKESITTTVSETYQTKEDMKNYATQSQLTQTNDKVTIAFQNSQSVGGQNLLLGTGVPTVVTGSGGENQCVAYYSLAAGSLKNLPVGMYHMQFKIKSDTAGGTAFAQWNSEPYGLGSSTKVNIGTTEQTYSVDYYITNNNYPNAKQMSVRLDNAQGNVTIREMKLEPGNSMTPWTEAPEDTINDLTNAVQNQAADIAGKVSNDDYTGYVNETNKNLSDIQNSQQHLSDAVNNEIKLRESYIQFGQDESNPYMDMGNSSSPNKMRLTNTKLSFTSNNIEVASVSNDKMRISNAEVLQSFRIGNFVWQPRSDGHMALKYSPEV